MAPLQSIKATLPPQVRLVLICKLEAVLQHDTTINTFQPINASFVLQVLLEKDVTATSLYLVLGATTTVRVISPQLGPVVMTLRMAVHLRCFTISPDSFQS